MKGKVLLTVLLPFCTGVAMAFSLSSTAFKAGEEIPAIYTCMGMNHSPPLSWSAVPPGTKTMVLIVDDPDALAGVWDHWLIFNIPAAMVGLTENQAQLPAGAELGKNSWGLANYRGPCPPQGEHRYIFKLYALDVQLDLPKGVGKKQLEVAMQGHILATTKLLGRYRK